MAQLPWVRMDTGIPHHPKVLALISDGAWRAVAVWHFMIEWCGANDNGGYIPHYALGSVHARRADMAKLVEVGLLDVVQGGWQLHDYDERQHVDAAARKRSEHAQRAANKRWEGHNAAKGNRHLKGL